MNLSIGVTPTKGTAYLGFAVVIFGLLKFIFAITNEGSLGPGSDSSCSSRSGTAHG